MTALGRTLMTTATRRPARRASQAPGVNAFWGLAYYLSAAPLVVTQGAQIAYIVIGAVWESDGRRPRALGSIYAPSPDWPPFSVPTLAFAGMAVVIGAMAVEMAVRPAATPSGRQPGSMAALWAAGAVLVSLHVWGFTTGVSGMIVGFSSSVVMGASAVTALVAQVKVTLDRKQTNDSEHHRTHVSSLRPGRKPSLAFRAEWVASSGSSRPAAAGGSHQVSARAPSTNRGRRSSGASDPISAGFWVVAYYGSLVPVLVIQSFNIVLVIIAVRWEADGRRSSEIETVFESSPGWPPVDMPGLVFVGMGIGIVPMAVEMVVRRGRTPSGSQPGLMSFVWAADGLLCLNHWWAFDAAPVWAAPAGLAGFTMLASAGVAFVVYLIRGVRRLLARRRGDPAADEPVESLDPVRARLLRGTGVDR